MRLPAAFSALLLVALIAVATVSVAFLGTSQSGCANPSDAVPRSSLSELERRIADLEAENKRVTALNVALQSRLPPHDPRVDWFQSELHQWVELHQQILNHTLPPRWLYCMDHYGLGNRVQVVVSCVMYAMLTKRALVTKLHVEGFIHPTVLLTHPTIDYNKMHEPHSVPLMCEDWRGHDKHEWIRLRGPAGFDYFGSMIWYNPHFKLFNKLPVNFFQMVFNTVLKLDPRLQEQADDFKRRRFGRYTIALHIREQIKKFDPNAGRLPVQGIDLTWQTARTMATVQTVVPPEDVVFFVACENPDTILALEKEHGNKTIVYVPFKSGTRDHSDAALAFYLIGECDEIITTDTSTYATNAAARAGKIPILCNANGFCLRKLTPQPTELYLSPPVPHCHGLYDSVDNSPGFWYAYYDRLRHRKEQYDLIDATFANQTRDGTATLQSSAELLRKSLAVIRDHGG